MPEDILWVESELISGPRSGESPCNLYNPLLFFLGAKASNLRVVLSITKHPSNLKTRVLCWSAKDPTLNRFLVILGMYKTDEMVFISPDRTWTSTFPTPATLWLWPPADQTWAPLVGWIDEKTNESPDTWWVDPESRYQEVVCWGVSSMLSSTKQASTTWSANSKLSEPWSCLNTSSGSSRWCTYPLKVRLRRSRSLCS